MLRRYKLEIDDNIILNNLETFKAQLNAQMQYCEDVQNEIKKSNETLLLREKAKQDKIQRAMDELSRLIDSAISKMDPIFRNPGTRQSIPR